MSIVILVVILVAVERLGELCYAERNTRALRRRGAIEIGRSHYPLIVLLHAAWLVAIFALIPPETRPDPLLLGLFVALQGVRLWVLASLGPYWTTRIVTLPDAPLIRRGPYRILRHPNYAVVVAEIAILPLAFGAWGIAVTFSLANALMLAWRIRVEEQALAPRRELAATP